ncbi:PorP/SprF family type IX secretion system membrane protein [Flavobacteriaceae bacterium]|jgi:type IX secretion system PorP/SprF family membrane protein|nr:PorP/SprF family type IX secretion system membrane protein [Flavobacteriaceae bacterium]MDB4066336.1 PorP/SprF family type IX secretion system membrane protein [Flavobacteriaceae bacterium]MDB9988926.1 PorP/SprF family type IX secretion system membrane protein [Flavobacteriaceae bacterium]
MNKNLVLIIVLFLFLNIHQIRGQQELNFNHYMLNSQVFNPAFVGLEENLTISLLNSLQWIGFEGNPTINAIFLDAKLKNNLGLGMELISDKIGPISSNFVAINAAYHLKLNKNSRRLSLGIKLSGNDHNISLNRFNFDDLTDPNVRTKDSYFITNIGFGLRYYTDKIYFSFSIPYFFETKTINKKRHYYLSGGFKKELNKKLLLNPNFLIKKASNAPTSIDVSTMLFYEDLFWFGINYGASDNGFISPNVSGGNLSFISGFKLIPALSIGYSVTSQIGNWTGSANSRSHEIYIKFSTSKKSVKSSDETLPEEKEIN